ncbi:MAG: ribosomal-processing cysteine protease Prp [Candidatus Eremiobacteraeota bacterium]|nr:ribosomal-processing cysteine protease Prp [Candidatus Eremiobacteraeota bacterium]
MVEVRARRDSRDRLSSFFASGHAGWAEAGQDVVCAAVSALLQAAWMGLTEVAKIPVEGSRSDGALSLAWPREARDDPAAMAIVETTARSIEYIARQYPEHVRFIPERGTTGEKGHA